MAESLGREWPADVVGPPGRRHRRHRRRLVDTGHGPGAGLCRRCPPRRVRAARRPGVAGRPGHVPRRPRHRARPPGDRRGTPHRNAVAQRTATVRLRHRRARLPPAPRAAPAPRLGCAAPPGDRDHHHQPAGGLPTGRVRRRARPRGPRRGGRGRGRRTQPTGPYGRGTCRRRRGRRHRRSQGTPRPVAGTGRADRSRRRARPDRDDLQPRRPSRPPPRRDHRRLRGSGRPDQRGPRAAGVRHVTDAVSTPTIRDGVALPTQLVDPVTAAVVAALERTPSRASTAQARTGRGRAREPRPLHRRGPRP